MPDGLTAGDPLTLESEWDFSQASFHLDDDLVAVGADLEPGTLVQAYAHGVFPMGLGEGGEGPLGWWSPRERGVLTRGSLRVSRSLGKSCRRFRVTFDEDFDGVIDSCADARRDGAWITPDIAQAYVRMHRLGVAHSVEVWSEEKLVGGLYGLALGGLFAGESMFHHERDASKVALCALADVVFASREPRLIDTQWLTPHLRSLGASSISRDDYLVQVKQLVTSEPIRWPATEWALGNR